MREFRRCTVCNKLYIATRGNAKYCSVACRTEGTYALKRAYTAEKPKPRRKKKQSVTEIAVAARKAGMTYGQYVAMVECGMAVERRENEHDGESGN